MGNEKSALNGLKIDEQPVEITDFWIHYMAYMNGHNIQNISVFISEPSLHYNANFGNPSPLEKAAKNLMLYRHPCILKYVSSWSKAEDILKLKDPADVPSLLEFKQFCKENLQNPDPSLRTELSHILQHPFFTHDFMKIYAFLDELPLKNSQEKEIFFRTLIKKLKIFPENIIAEQLGRLLLSRMVLLDITAQEQLLPFILKPKDGNDKTGSNLFSISTFKVYLVPKLLQMFCIRDVSIRLVLLSHFNSFVYTFQDDELKSQILPELLVGIKDTNDHLVSATLKALADIVPILGAATVIGGKRGKLFTDGRPNKLKDNNEIDNNINIAQLTIPMSIQKIIDLPERPSPDGGEDKKEITSSIIEKEYTWSDWDVQETGNILKILQPSNKISQFQSKSNDISIPNSTLKITDVVLNKNKTTELKLTKKSSILSDISELDIKNSKLIDSIKEEYNYFTDMEPVIKKTQILHVQQPQIIKSIFDVTVLNELVEENNGWEEDLSDWETEDFQEVKN
ncbi:uncharacterized protein LOC102672145 isoform X3 [Apis dorsata]|uniref:uncharacterized protein LOC102672145 isoform X3 n=1 Tax=Apis dorsata TaxID=7462 RepID=UPI0003DF711A|nr:uncharacterized protein LOC102672145 isoform X3 [Apis dorsata]